MKNLKPSMNDLSPKTRAAAVALLNQALADLSDLYSQTKQAHWNVHGPYFFTLHKLFDEIAEPYDEALDSVAERIVQLGGVAKGTVRMAAKSSALDEFEVKGKHADDPLAYAKVLAAQYAVCAKSIRKATDESAAFGDADTADLLTGISRDLDKSLWFIEAHMRKA